MSANKITSRNADTLDGQHAPTSAIVGVDSTQTLTNKTLTSPKLNEDVAITATATEVNKLYQSPTNLLGNRSANKEFIQRGTSSFTCTSGAGSITGTITYPVAFTNIRCFVATPTPYGNFAAAEMPIFIPSTPGNSSVEFYCKTVDGGTWAANRTLVVQWIAIGD